MTKPNVVVPWAETGTKVDPGEPKKSLGWVAEIPPYEYWNFWAHNVDVTNNWLLENTGVSAVEFANVEDMLQGTPIRTAIGGKCSTGAGKWLHVSGDGTDITHFRPLNGLWLDDWVTPSDNDDTQPWLRANNYAEYLGGQTVNLPPREILISMAESSHSYACVLIPENVKVKGPGREFCIVTRPASDRAVDGVLIVNKNYDTTGNYGASGNVKLSGFKITDGTATKERNLGDLIGLGHGKNLEIFDMEFGEHDQHAIDIASCDGVKIYNNIGLATGGDLASGGSSTIQIDGAKGLGIYGLFITATGPTDYAEATSNIEIYGNDLENYNSPPIGLFHANYCRYNNIIIRDNPRLASRKSGGSIVNLDTGRANVISKTLKILNNGFEGGVKDIDLIRLIDDRPDNSWDDWEIAHNYGTGNAETGPYNDLTKYSTFGKRAIDIGNSPSFFAGLFGNQTFTNINIHDNNFIIYSNNAFARPFNCGNISGWVNNNLWGLREDTTKDQPLCKIITPRGLEFKENSFYYKTQSGVAGDNSACVELTKDLGFASAINIADNYLIGDNLAFRFKQGGGSWVVTDDIKVSSNKFIGLAPKLADIEETTACSDGTNGWKQVDLGGTDGARDVVSGGLYLHNSGLTKRGGQTGVKLDIQYATTLAKFATDMEQLQSAYISATQFVGLQCALINPGTGDFQIRTGNEGVSVVINNTTFEPVIRTSGTVKIFASI